MTIFGFFTRPIARWLEENRLLLLKIVAITVVIFSAAILAPRVALGHRRVLLLLALLIGIFPLYGALRWPVMGLIVTLVAGFFIPISGPGGFNVSQLGLAALLGVWILDMLVIKRNIRFIHSRTIPPLFLFILLSIVSFGFGQLSWFVFANNAPINAQMGGLAIYILSVGAFLLVAHLIQDQRWLEWLTWVFISIGAVYIFGRILHVPVDNYYIQRAISNSMFWTWLGTLAFSQALFNTHLRFQWRISLFMLTLGVLYVAMVVNYDWKSGWVPLVLGFTAIICVRYWRIALFVAPFVLIPASIYIGNKAISTDQYSWGTRLDAWFIVLEMAKISPILGLGFANYRFYTPFYSFRGFNVEFNSHSQYVDLIAQLGFAGLAIYLWFFGEIFFLGLWLRDRVPEGFARAYVYACIGGIVGTLASGFLVDWVLPFVYNIGLEGFRSSILAWIFMGGLVSLEQAVRSKNPSPREYSMQRSN